LEFNRFGFVVSFACDSVAGFNFGALTGIPEKRAAKRKHKNILRIDS
jgi:hypothetical protein